MFPNSNVGSVDFTKRLVLLFKAILSSGVRVSDSLTIRITVVVASLRGVFSSCHDSKMIAGSLKCSFFSLRWKIHCMIGIRKFVVETASLFMNLILAVFTPDEPSFAGENGRRE